MKQKVIVIPDSFKGSMSSEKVADIIGDVLDSQTDLEVVRIPIADGGEGSTNCIMRSMGGEKIHVTVTSPEGKQIEAFYLITPDKKAVIEIAESSGITKQTSFNATKATTYGFGELIKDALDKGARSFLLCLGGSATTDCAAGMAAALGVKFFDGQDEEFTPVGGTLKDIARIDLSGLDKRVGESDFVVMSDVTNPLFGPKGAAYIYAPQKGANAEEVALLDEGIKHISKVMEEAVLISCEGVQGAGAAGGAGYGCAAFLGARIVSGINAMLDICRFDELVSDAKYIVTGEGKFDEQSLMGKVVDGIRKRSGNIPMVVFCGISDIDTKKADALNIRVIEIGRNMTLEESIKNAEKNLKEAATKLAKEL